MRFNLILHIITTSSIAFNLRKAHHQPEQKSPTIILHKPAKKRNSDVFAYVSAFVYSGQYFTKKTTSHIAYDTPKKSNNTPPPKRSVTLYVNAAGA